MRENAASAREEVLGRIRVALGTPSAPPAPGLPAAAGAIPREYRVRSLPGTRELAALLAERLRDYGAAVRTAAPGEAAQAVGAALAGRGARRVVVPPGLDLAALGLTGPGPGAAGPGIDVVVDGGLSAAELDRFDAVVTTAAVAIAETGTIVLDGSPGQGRRALTLVPDYHLCVVREDQVVGLVPEAIARLDPGRPLTWISGPSATSDIELDRVQGVHGPRTLEVILVSGQP